VTDGDRHHPGQVLSALASEQRLRVLAALVLAGPATAEDLATSLGGSEDLGRALLRLADAGLVSEGGDGTWRAEPATLAAAARLASRLRADPDPTELGASPQQAVVLRAYLRNGRLRSIPVQRTKRRVVLDWISQQFEPGRVYSEEEVNRILGRYHSDHAALRRYLVDEEFMDRRHGTYWRAGGTFDVG
jgi:hypothetical protein